MIKRIVINQKIPSLNVTLRKHWAWKAKLKKSFALEMMQFKKELKGKVFNKLIIISFRTRKLDYDNLVGGAKECVVDNIKKFGWIKDDSPKYCDISYHQEVCKNEKTEVYLY